MSPPGLWDPMVRPTELLSAGTVKLPFPGSWRSAVRVSVRTLAVSLAVGLVLVGCGRPAEHPAKPKFGTWGVDMAQMDRSVRPGNDFFAYAVGGWLKNAKIPADKVCAGVNLDIQNQLNADLRAIVEGAGAKHAPAGDISQQIGDLFASYMDEAALNKNGVEPVRPLLSSIEAINDRAALSSVLVSFNAKTRVSDPFWVSVTIDPNKPTRYIPSIWQGGLSLGERNYYLDTDDQAVELRNKVHFAGCDVREAGSFSSLGGDRCHLGCDVGEHHGTARSHDCGRGNPHAAWAAGELEHAVPALKAGGIQHRLRHHGSPRLDVLGKLTPRGCDRRPDRA